MPKIYDNIENQLSYGLKDTLNLSIRCDFCVGYFNLRGWHEIADKIDALDGMMVFEKEDQQHRYCRLLVGMQKLPSEILKDYCVVSTLWRHGEEVCLLSWEKSRGLNSRRLPNCLSQGLTAPHLRKPWVKRQ